MSIPGPSYHYSWSTARPAAPGRITTSRREIRDITIAFLVLTLDLMLILGGANFVSSASGFGSFLSLGSFAIAASAALTGFLAHELAHKIVAQRRHNWAEFRMSPMGLIFSLVTAWIGFLFAAPGATVVGGMTDVRGWGSTSLAGPLTNVAFAGAFLFGAYACLSLGASPDAIAALLLLAFFNAWFAAFNLIPFGPLDGHKILAWSSSVWVAAMVAGAGLTVGSYYLSYAFASTGHLVGV